MTARSIDLAGLSQMRVPIPSILFAGTLIAAVNTCGKTLQTLNTICICSERCCEPLAVAPHGAQPGAREGCIHPLMANVLSTMQMEQVIACFTVLE